ncbi:extracellular calcium-sensing receptor-like, partial [Clarias magur]
VSHYATCACLSDKHEYPAFFRTIPSDHHQAGALAKMVKHFGWTWIGAVRSDTDYGNNGMASFLKAAQKEGICVEYSEVYYRTQSPSKLERIANVIRRSTARVLLAFMHTGDMRFLLEELARQPPPPLQWIGSDTWITDPDFLRYNMCAGAIGFSVPRSVIPGLREFLLDLTPAQVVKSALLTEFWERSFTCHFKERTDIAEGMRKCDGSEDILTLQNPYTDMSQLRVTNMVYKATYAIAHAIHGLICNDTHCDKNIKFTPWQHRHTTPNTVSMDYRELRFARAMQFSIHEINNSTDLLPGITLGYQIHDSCSSVPMSIKVAFQFANGVESELNEMDVCSKSATAVPAIVGESASTPSISMARMLGLFGIPQVSHYATCSCLSDKHQYPAFFRTIPSDQHQAAALARMVKHFGWTWIGAVRSDSDYGNYGMASFLNAAQKEGICVEYSEAYYRTQPRSKLERVANVIRRSSARVIVAFIASGDMRFLLEELAQQPLAPLQWIGSETWIIEPELLRYNLCAGAIGFGIPRSVIPGFRDFLLDLTAADALKSPLFTEFWESSFACSLKDRTEIAEGARQCDGSEDISNHLMKVNFTTNSGFQVSFDSNGDPPATYELINWQLDKDDSQPVPDLYLKSPKSCFCDLLIRNNKTYWREMCAMGYFSKTIHYRKMNLLKFKHLLNIGY